MATLWAVYDRVNGKKLSSEHLRFKASFHMAELVKINPHMDGRVELRECGEIGLAALEEKQRRAQFDLTLDLNAAELQNEIIDNAFPWENGQ